MEDSQEWGQGRIVMAMVGGSLAVLLLLVGTRRAAAGPPPRAPAAPALGERSG